MLATVLSTPVDTEMVGEIAARMLKSLDSIVANVWRYGLVKADHYRPIKEQNLIQPLLTIPLVIHSAV